MSCQFDMDCLYGMRSCLHGTCRSLQPYNPDHPCSTDLDCPHVGYYCPDDPTTNMTTGIGEDPYFVKFCRRQRNQGDKCTQDRECYPGTVCNDVERPPRCRAYFSIERGGHAKDPHLCITGWTDKHHACAVAAQSKSMGRSCGADEDCETTDQTGKTGTCTCRLWWDGGEPKYCQPVFGDLDNYGEKVRDWLWFRSRNCGTFWSDEECVAEFPNDAAKLNDVQCEMERLSKGPYLPPAGCRIPNPKFQGISCGGSPAPAPEEAVEDAGEEESVSRRLTSWLR